MATGMMAMSMMGATTTGSDADCDRSGLSRRGLLRLVMVVMAIARDRFPIAMLNMAGFAAVRIAPDQRRAVETPSHVYLELEEDASLGRVE
ncbi:hypothetical protein P280DRAFT_468014 [Massarina eburnea CBS 473.64]|uniref:Uncharacterized protein n=1 Tax=Massarina eburnea CBS 473.64 TaxID=1395130 RepID=A0A6A6S541_9PLEO|nr:hypothetical protein P280DRAFT_468014 [Massarina eburnea CBS 473.64]